MVLVPFGGSKSGQIEQKSIPPKTTAKTEKPSKTIVFTILFQGLGLGNLLTL